MVVQKALVEDLIARKRKFNNDFESDSVLEIDRIVEIVKKIVQSDKDRFNTIDEIIKVHAYSICWNVLSLPFIINVTDELKNSIAAHPDLVRDIGLVKIAFSRTHKDWAMQDAYREQVISFLSAIEGQQKIRSLPILSSQPLSLKDGSLNVPDHQNQETINNNNPQPRPLPELRRQQPSLLQKFFQAAKQRWKNNPHFWRCTIGAITFISVFSYLNFRCVMKYFLSS